MRSKNMFRFISILVLLSLMFIFTIPAAAAGEKSITLISISYTHGKGVVFKFNVQGDFSNFSGTALVAGHEYPLSCRFNDFGELNCAADQGLSQYVWEYASGQINGYAFGDVIRDTDYCYNVWDYDTSYVWHIYDVVCGSEPATWGNWVEYYNWDWDGIDGDGWYYAYYDLYGLACAPYGEAFYYENGCPK